MVLVAPCGSYRIAAYTSAALALGMSIIVISDSEHSLVPEVANGITVDFRHPGQAYAAIIEAIASLDVECVLSTDDSCVEICSRIAGYLGLPQNSAGTALLTRRKDLGRKALLSAGCNTPAFQVIAITGASPVLLSIDYPVVIKPLTLAASRGVIRADNDAEFVAAVRRIDAIVEAAGQQGFARANILVESYIDGPEFAVEGFVIDGKFNLLAVFDKPEPLNGPYFEETYYLTPSRLDPDRKAELIDEITSCCHAYGLQHGPVHAEARLSSSGPILLELAARTIGGQCGQLIEFSLRQKLEQLVIQGMCGFVPQVDQEVKFAGVLMIPITDAGILKRVEGLTEALQTDFIRDIEIHIRPGYELIPLPEGASYLGFIFAQAPAYDETYAALKTAYSMLRFVTTPNWELEYLTV